MFINLQTWLSIEYETVGRRVDQEASHDTQRLIDERLASLEAQWALELDELPPEESAADSSDSELDSCSDEDFELTASEAEMCACAHLCVYTHS